MFVQSTLHTEVRSAKSADDLVAIREFLRREDFLTTTRHPLLREAYPSLLPEHTRFAVQDGQIAGVLTILTDTLSVGEARLKGATLRLALPEDTEGRDALRVALVEDAHRYLEEHRYHLSCIFHAPAEFESHGYGTAYADYRVDIATDDIAIYAPRAYRSRPSKPADLRLIQRIHESSSQNIPGAPLRIAGHFSSKWEEFRGVRVFFDGFGKVVGYLWPRIDKNALTILEIAERDSGARLDMLAWCVDEAREHLLKHIRFATPPGHRFARFLEQYPAVNEREVLADHQGMMRVVDVGETLENMIPEWEQRIHGNLIALTRVELTLLVDGTPYRIRGNHGSIDVMRASASSKFAITRANLAALLVGYARWEELFANERRIISHDARAFMNILFPHRDPYVFPFDRL